MGALAQLAENLSLGSLLEAVGDYELIAHWTQGEFHHDVVVAADTADLPGRVLVVATNCNGGVKEVIAFDEAPDRWALWHHRCPDNPEFSGAIPEIKEATRTVHWFDPCELLGDDARSELLPEHRVRQRGGGWGLVRASHARVEAKSRLPRKAACAPEAGDVGVSRHSEEPGEEVSRRFSGRCGCSRRGCETCGLER